MKLYVVFILSLQCCLGFSAMAQIRNPATFSAEESGELTTTDPVSNGLHYKQLPMTLKKGMGAVFYMHANTFMPQLALLSPGDGGAIGRREVKEGATFKESKVIFIAPADTSFIMLFTSDKENTTGKFSYGYYILDSSAMAFNSGYSTCQRLFYLINQWQAEWDLIPSTTARITDEDGIIEYRQTNNTLLKASATEIHSNYKETLFTSKDYATTLNYHKKISDEIKNCLDPSFWTTDDETVDEKMSAFSKETQQFIIRHFRLKAAPKNSPFSSFKIVLKPGLVRGIVAPYEVQLVFE
jgi:hypothetical protein